MHPSEILDYLTKDTTWTSVDGPDTGHGTDFYWRNWDNREAYANLDAGVNLRIVVDGEVIFDDEPDALVGCHLCGRVVENKEAELVDNDNDKPEYYCIPCSQIDETEG